MTILAYSRISLFANKLISLFANVLSLARTISRTGSDSSKRSRVLSFAEFPPFVLLRDDGEKRAPQRVEGDNFRNMDCQGGGESRAIIPGIEIHL